MPLSLFPSTVRGLTYTTVKTQEFSTLVQTAPNMIETRFQQTANPIWHWELLYEVLFDQSNNLVSGLLYTDLKTMVGFLASMQGKYDDFLYSDPDDNSVGPGIISPSTPNLQAQLQVVTDGTNFYSPIQIYRGGQFWEDVTDLNGPITLYENGTLSTAFVSLGWGGLSVPGAAFSGLYVNWGTYTPTQPVTATFNYYYRVHFEEDKQDFEKFLFQLWTMGGSESKNSSTNSLKFMSSRVSSGTSSLEAPPVLPAPPIAFPPGSTKFQVFWPSSLTTSVGTSAATGWAGGASGVNAYGVAELISQSIGTSGGSCTFSGWAAPTNIPLSSVKGIYAWCPYIHTGGLSGTALANINFIFNGGSLGGVLSAMAGSFLTSPQTFNPNLIQLNTLWGSSIASFPYTTIQVVIGLQAASNGFYYDFVRGRPLVLVYY